MSIRVTDARLEQVLTREGGSQQRIVGQLVEPVVRVLQHHPVQDMGKKKLKILDST